VTQEDAEIAKAIEMSMGAGTYQANYEPLNPEQRLREAGVPVGLQNIGNSKLRPD